MSVDRWIHAALVIVAASLPAMVASAQPIAAPGPFPATTASPIFPSPPAESPAVESSIVQSPLPLSAAGERPIFAVEQDPIFDPFLRRSAFASELAGNATSQCTTCGPSACGRCGCASCRCPQKPAPCIECPHVSTLLPHWNVHVFGTLQGNVMFNTARAVAPGIPLFLAPGTNAQQNTVDVFARSSSLGALIVGPKIGEFQASALALVYFYNDALIVDRYGILPVQAWGDLKNEDWRFAAGLQFNVFSPNIPTMLTFSSMLGSGNTGNNFVGQFRIERFLHPSDDSQWTIQAAISDPVATGVITNQPISSIITGAPALRLTEDNGWPTLEGRIAYSRGKLSQVGLEQKRALELGLSAVGGQLRTAIPLNPNVVANTYGVSSDYRWAVNDRFGFQGEAFIGEGLGFQNGGILQSTNSTTFNGIRTRGAWGEVYYFLNPCLHTHTGAGIDDPIDRDLAAAQVSRNQTVFSNLIWDVTRQLRFGVEVAYRETDYIVLQNNRGTSFQSQVQWSF